MNTTIAVAIITAVATIVSGSAAAMMTLITQTRQTEIQQRSQRHQARREAYVDYLTKIDEVTAILDNIWLGPLPSSESDDVISRLVNPVNYYMLLRVALNTVLLEGPNGTRDAAFDLSDQVSEEVKMIISCANENAGKPGAIGHFADREEIISKRSTVKNKFISAAAEALNLEVDLQGQRWQPTR